MIVTLGELTKSTRPICYGVLKPGPYVSDGIPLIRVTDISSNILVTSNLHKISFDLDSEFKRSKLNGGELLLSIQGTIGKVAICPIEMAGSNISRTIAVIDPDERVYKEFLRYYFLYLDATNQHYSTGSTRASLNIGYLRKLKIPLPPLSIQKKIAAILDAADAYRQKTKALIEKYDELAQSLFLDMFGDPVRNEKGWEQMNMMDVCNKVTDGTHDTPNRLKSGVKFITGKHVRPYEIDYDNSDYVDAKDHHEIYRRCNPEMGDVLYTNIGANVGTAAMNIVDYEFSMKNVALMKPKRSLISGRFLEYYLNSQNMKSKIIRIASIGGAQQFLSLKEIRKLPVLIPPLQLQENFNHRVNMVIKQRHNVLCSLEKADILFQSLLQRAFKGELVNH